MFVQYLIILILFGFTASLNITITPAETSDFGQEDVTVECAASGLDGAVAIRSMELSKVGSNQPLASLYPTDTVHVNPPPKHDIQASGRIIPSHPSESVLTVTLVDPIHVQSGDYTCSVIYLDNHQAVKTAQASSTLKINRVDISTILKEVKRLQKQEVQYEHLSMLVTGLETENRLLQDTDKRTKERDDKLLARINALEDSLTKRDGQTKDLTGSLRDRINAMEGSLTNKDSEILGLKKAITKLTEEKRTLENTVSGVQDQIEALTKTQTQCCKETNSLTDAIKDIHIWIGNVACKGDWQPFNGLCYKEFAPGEVTWYDAQEHCKSLGGIMAVIPDQETNEYFHKTFKWNIIKYGHWIGLRTTSTDIDSDYTWTDGTKAIYTNWEKDLHSRSAGQHYCVDFFPNNGEWNQYNCNVKDQFVCQIKPTLIETSNV